MKNAQRKRLTAVLALTVLTVIFLTNCNGAGLGTAVDTKAPTVAVTYPPTDSVIRGTFVMSGTAEDETGVSSVNVVLTKLPAALGVKTDVIIGTIDNSTQKSWTASINTQDAATGAYAIPDGKYEALVTVKDTIGRTSTTTVIYTIDNTKPIVAVSQPATRGTQNPWEFGSELNFTGLQYDENISGLFTIDFFGSEGAKISSYKGTNVLTDWSLDVKEGDAAFQALKTAMTDVNIPQKFWYTITVEDLAREFKNPAEAADTVKTGNSSTYYYSWTDISSLLVAGDFAPKINALYSLDSGFNVSASEMPASITYNKLQNIRIYSNTAAEKITAECGAFTIDPNNKQPVIETDGILPGENRSKDNQIGKGETIRFEIKKNKDGTPILVNEMTCRLDTFTGNAWVNGTAKPIALSEITQGTTIVYNYSAPVDVGIYRLVFDVKDLNKSSARNSTYEFIVNAGAPVFTIAPGASIYAPGGTFTSYITASDDSNSLTLKVQRRDAGALAEVSAYPEPVSTTTVTGTEGNYTSVWSVTLPAAANGSSITYRFEVSDGKWSNSKEQSFTTDNASPVLLELSSPSMPVTDGKGTQICSVASPGITVIGRASADLRQARVRVTSVNSAPDADISSTEWKVVNVSADGSGKFTAALELPSNGDGVIEGNYYAWYRFADDTYDDVTKQMGSVTKLFDIVADKNDPNLTYTINGALESTIADSLDGFNQLAANFTIAGKTWDAIANSSAGIGSLSYTHYLYNGGTGTNDVQGTANTVLSLSSDGTWTIPEISGDGKHTFTITATDWAGKTKVVNVKVQKDIEPPVLAITNPSNNQYISGGITITGTVSDPGVGVKDVQITFDGGTTWKTSVDGLTFNESNWSYTPTAADIGAEGAKTLYVWATDKVDKAVYPNTLAGISALTAAQLALYRRNFTYDSSDPTLTITNPAGNQDYTSGDSYNFAFTAEDTQGIDTLAYKLNGAAEVSIFGTTTVLPAGLSNASGDRNDLTVTSYTISGIPEGNNEIEFILTDKALKKNSKTIRIIRDTEPPVITITSVVPSIDDSPNYKINGIVTVKGSFADALDGQATTFGVALRSGQNSVFTSAPTATSLGFTAVIDTRSVLELDSVPGITLADIFDFDVRDKMNNSALDDNASAIMTELRKYRIDQTSDIPVLDGPSFSTSAANSSDVTTLVNLFTASQYLSGILTDDDGISSVEFYVDTNGDGTADGGALRSITGINKTVYNLNVKVSELGLAPKATHRIQMRVTDTKLGTTDATSGGNYGRYASPWFYIGIDTGAPSITIDGSVGGTVTTGAYGEQIDLGQLTANKTVSGTANGSFTISSTILNSLSKTGSGDGVNNGEDADPEDDGSWTLTLTKPASSVAEIIAVTASDNFGRNVIKRFSYIFDLDAPILSVTAPASHAFKKAAGAPVAGNANEASAVVTQSGLDSIEYTVKDGKNTALAGSETWKLLTKDSLAAWSGTINDFGLSADGWYTIHFRSKDKSGNYSITDSEIYYADSTAPVLTTEKNSVSSSAAELSWYEKGSFSLEGTIVEATRDDLDTLMQTWSYAMYYQADTGAAYSTTPTETADMTLYTNTTGNDWTLPATSGADGKYKYVITATDRAGYSAVITREIFIDTAAPVLEITNLSDGNVISTADYTYRGTLSDTPAGPKNIYYQITQSASPAAPGTDPVAAGYTSMSAVSGSWAISKNNVSGTTPSAGKLHEGRWYLHILADDTAGNFNTPVETIPFIVDLADPSGDETLIAAGTVYKTSLFNMNLNFGDTNALSNLTIVQKVEGSSPVTIRDLDYTTEQSQSLSLNSLPHTNASNTSVAINGSADGLYTYDITIYDMAGKSKFISRTIQFDTQKPTVDITSVTPAVEDGASYNINGITTVKGSFTDNDRVDTYAIALPARIADGTVVINSQSSSGFTATVDTRKMTDGQTLNDIFNFVVADKAGNTALTAAVTAELTKYAVSQPSDTPETSDSSFSTTAATTSEVGPSPAKVNLFTADQYLTATLSDDDGISSVQFFVDTNGDGTADGGAIRSITGINKTVYNLNVKVSELGLASKATHRIQMRVTDTKLGTTDATSGGNYGRYASPWFYIGIDTGAPSITIDGSVGGTVTTGAYGEQIDLGQLTANKTVSGTANGSFTISSTILNSLSKTGSGDGVNNGEDADPEDDGSWTLTLTKPASSVAEIIAVTASDNFGRNVIKRFSYIFDLDAPILSVTAPASHAFKKAAGAPVAGNANEASAVVTQSGLDSIEYTVKDGKNTALAGSETWKLLTKDSLAAWSGTINDFGLSADGWYTIHFRSKDKSGNYSITDSEIYYADSTAPVLTTEKNSVSSSAAELSWYEKGSFSLEGTIVEATRDDLDTLMQTWSYAMYYQADTGAAYSTTPTETADMTLYTNTTGNDWTLPATSGADGKYKYVITATDRAGYSAVITREIFIDTAAPVLEITNLSDGNVISTADYTYRGTLSDTPAGPKNIYYQITQSASPAAPGTDPVAAGYTSMSAVSGSWAINRGNIEGTVAGTGADAGKLHEGQWYLHILADDTAGNFTTPVVSVMFIVDVKDPAVNETTIATVNTVDKTGLFPMSITISDTHALKNITIIQKRNGGEEVTLRNIDYTTEKNQTINLTSLPHSDGVNTSVASDGTADGLYTYDIEVTDYADKPKTITRSVRFDTQSPSISVTSPTADGWYSNASFNANGLISDTGSGAKNLHYAITQNAVPPSLLTDYTAVATANSWTITKTVDTGLSTVTPGNLFEGTWYLHSRAEDNVGNITASGSVSTVKFNLDRSNPVVTETVNGMNGVGEGAAVPKTGLFSLNLAASDTHSVKSLTVVQKKNGTDELTVYSNTGLSGVSFNHILSALPYESVGPVDSAEIDGSDDGLYTYDITLTDIAGKQHSITRSVRFDTKAPVVTIVSPAVNSWNGSAIVNVSGNAADDSGVQEVRYTVVAGALGSAPADPDTWTLFTGTTSITATITAPAQGVNTLWIYARDIRGNTNEFSLQSHVFRVDTQVPSLTVSGDSIRYIQSADTTVALAGQASDTAELDKVTITVNTHSQTINAPLTANNWTATAINVSEFTANTANVVEITAYDKYGRTKLEKVTVYRDTLAPVTTVTTVNQLLDFGGHTNTVNGIVKISGTLSDNTGIDGYRYTLSRSGYADKTTTVAGSAANFTINLNTLSAAVLDFDSNGTADDNFELTVLVESYDASGNVSNTGTTPASSGAFTLWVNQASDNPIITLDSFAAPVGGRYIFTTAEQVGATITDDDGIATSVMSISSGSLVAASPVPAADSRSGRFVQKLSGLAEGEYTLTLTITDNTAGTKISTQTIDIAIDNNNPAILSSLPNDQFRSASFGITLTVTDTAGINGNPSAVPNVAGVTVSAPTKTGDEYTYTVSIDDPLTFAETNVQVLFTANDNYGRSSSYNFTYKVDLTDPVIDSIVYPASDYINLPDSYTYRVTGTASDEALGSALNDVRYVVLDGNIAPSPASSDASWKPAAGLTSWTANVDMAGKTSGVYSLFVMVRDNAGNTAVSLRKLIYADTFAPSITPAAVSTRYNAGFVVTGTANDSADTNGNLISVTARANGTTDLVQDTGHTASSWRFVVPAGTDPSPLSDGQVEIVFTATDGSGKTKTAKVNFLLDTQDPLLTYTNIEGTAFNDSTVAAGDISAITTNFTSSSNRILGIFSDASSGVSELTYTFQRWNGTAFVQAGSVINDPRSNLSSGSISQTMDANVAALAGDKDGIWRVVTTISDAALNSATYYSSLFRLDQTKPTLSVDDLTKTTYAIGDTVTIEGSALDTNGGTLSSVNVRIIKGGVTKLNTNVTPDGLNRWSASYTILAGDGAGDFDIIVLATDTAGNSYEIKKKISCDITPPSIGFNRPYNLSVDTDSEHNTAGQTGTLIGKIAVQGSIPVTEFSMEEIYYQVGGSLTVTKGLDTFTIENEGYAELNAATGKISSIDAGSSGSITSGTGFQTLTGDLKGDWVKAGDKWSWAFEFDAIPLIGTSFLYPTPGKSGVPNLKTVNIYLVAIDTAGNMNLAVYPINLDTDIDKPASPILSPENNASVGGVFTITGSASDNNFVHSVYMQVELTHGNYDGSGNLIKRSNSALFSGTTVTGGMVYIPDGPTIDIADITSQTAYFTNRNYWYKVDFNSSTLGWKQRINNAGEFLNINLADFYEASHVYNPADQTQLTIRVIAIDTKTAGSLNQSVAGNPVQSIVNIDGDNPGIDLNQFPDHNSFVSGEIDVSITLTDNVRVDTFSIKAGSTTLATEANMDTTHNDLTITQVDVDEVTIVGTIDTTSLSSPVELTVNVADDLGKTSSITKKVYVDNDRAWDRNHGLLFGNTAYTDTRGVNDYLTLMGNESVIAAKATDVPDGSSIEGSGVKYILFYLTKNGRVYNTGGTVKDTSGTALFADAVTADVYSGGTYTEQIIDFPVASVSAISPNKYAVTSMPYIVIDSPEGGTDSDGDKYKENLKANNEWYIMLNTEMVNDGLYEANYLIFDNAGNITYYTDSILIANNPPTIASVVLATNINGDANLLINKSGTGGDEDFLFVYDDSGAIDASSFTVTNTSLKMYVNEIPGTGNDALTYHLRYPLASGATEEITSTTGEFVFGALENQIKSFPADTITSAQPSATRDGYYVWITDSTETSPAIALTSGEVNITLKLDNVDDINPTAQLYELNTTAEAGSTVPVTLDKILGVPKNVTMGSLYTTSTSPVKYSGHVEPRSSSEYNNVSATVRDSDVSGTIILRGNAYDNRRIYRISLIIGSVTRVFATADASGLLVLDGGAAGLGQLAQSLDNTGHYVEWSYAWDTTSNGSLNPVGQNINVRVLVEDAQLPTRNQSANTAYTEGSTNYNASTFDVMPYISSVVTNLDKLSLSKPSRFNRTAQGRYPVNITNTAGTVTSETITVNGFNLTGAEINDATTNISGNTATTLNYDVANLNSGPLNLTVNDIPLLNNENNNTKDWNKLPNNDNNNNLTDDVEFDVWLFNARAAVPINGTIANPVMKVSPNTSKMIGFAFTNGPLYFSMPGTVTAGTRGVPENGEYSYIYWQGSYDFMTSIAMAYDSDGHTYGAAAGGDINSTQADKFSFMTDRWGVSGVATGGSYGGTNANRIEMIAQNGDKGKLVALNSGTDYFNLADHGFSNGDTVVFSAGVTPGGMTLSNTYYIINANASSFQVSTTNGGTRVNFTSNGSNVTVARDEIYFDKQRIKNPEYATARHGTSTSIYMAYFDNLNEEIRFKYGNLTDGSGKGNFNNFEDAYRNGNVKTTDDSNLNNGKYSTARVNVIASTALTGRNPGEYVSLGVISDEGASLTDDVVVLVWYDSYDNKLMYTYNESPEAGTTGVNVANWVGPYEIFAEGGEYCKLAVDGNGGVHIASYNGMTGDLQYAYIEDYTIPTSVAVDVKTCIVDSYGIVGQSLTIDVAREDSSSPFIPYIGYYALSSARPKLAYLTSTTVADGAVDEAYTGNWEITLIPTINKVPQDNIGVALWKDSDGVIVNSSNTVDTRGTNWGRTYGNGTDNPVLGYAIKESSTKGYIETAQKR